MNFDWYTFSIKHKIYNSKFSLPYIGLGLIVLMFMTRVLASKYVDVSLAKSAQDFITLSTGVLVESLPFVLLGIALSIIVQVWLPNGIIIRKLPKHAHLRRASISLLGVFLPVCECGNVPLARGLMRQGMSVSESMTFLLAAPIINPVTIITTYQAFGHDKHIVVGRILGGLLIANIIGWLFAKHPDPNKLLVKEFADTCEVNDGHAGPAGGRLTRSFDIFRRESSSIMPALFIGALVAGMIQVAVPRSVLLSVGSSPVLSILAMILLAFTVSICSSVDAFFALAFSRTFTAGSIVSFLVFGPMIDIKMLLLMRTTYTVKTLVYLIVLVSLLSVILGMGINYAF